MSTRQIVSVLSLMLLPQFFSDCTGKENFNLQEWSDTQRRVDGKVDRVFDVKDSVDYDWPADSLLQRYYSGVECALRKARQLASLRWTPVLNVPSCYGIYSKNEAQNGAPYSLAYMTSTQIGTQISLHTFMTALQNPYSVLYTEDLSSSSYGGASDSSVYYGTTCSNSVLYVLGVETPYYTRMFSGIPGMKKAASQTPDSIELCDVLWQQGHVMMVYGIERDDSGAIQSVQIFETTRTNQRDTWIRDLSYNEFTELWKRSSFVRYQYQYLNDNTDYEMSVFIPLDDEPVYDYHYNYLIAPTLGDRCTYLEGSEVRLTVFSELYPEIHLYKDGAFYTTVKAEYPLTRISGLPYGQYRACLVRDDIRSGFTYFEIVNSEIKYDSSQRNLISFESQNASPRYILFSDSQGRPNHYYSFTDAERGSGVFNRKIGKSDTSTHFRVYYRGRYGVIASDLFKL